jgi:hypothetical protein
MKTIGWVAIIYNVHDVLTFGAVLLLIIGECAVTYRQSQTKAEVIISSCRQPVFR